MVQVADLFRFNLEVAGRGVGRGLDYGTSVADIVTW